MKMEDVLALILAGVVCVFLAYGCGLVIDGGLDKEVIKEAMP